MPYVTMLYGTFNGINGSECANSSIMRPIMTHGFYIEQANE